jgi:alanyl-tRNA synthetase
MSDDGDEKVEFITAMTAKEIKKIARPEFAANPEKFYPVDTLKGLGYERTTCPTCNNNFWRRTASKVTCGDSQCEKRYGFIGVGTGIGKAPSNKKITYAEAWEGFRRSLTTARIPCTAIQRYPVVARWRADVDFVAAGIFCFQPYCVTGELEPPANPLICPQFCLRFNDLDNIGLTGRHYSGFIMLGIQVFNKPNDYKFWSSECVEFNHRWLTQELGIDPNEITFIEDVWAGGGNLGPSIEYFVNGLELGNMVFMQFKTFPDGSREPLQVQVIDVGIGLERVPWLVNGSPTSYCDVFPRALKFLLDTLGMSIQGEVWEKYGPLSCLLNVDEVDDIEKTWAWIAGEIGLEAKAVKEAIEPIRDLYVVLDHTRSVLMATYDGSLPSNDGGAANVRSIFRRSLAILAKRGWWDTLKMEGFLQLFEHHKEDLATIYGPFKAYKSFEPIIRLEYQRWASTDDTQKVQLERLMKKRNNKLTLDDWITCTTSWGLPADTVAAITKTDIPGNLWYEIADRQERTVKAVAPVLYSTAHLPATNSLYYGHEHEDPQEVLSFSAKILEVMPDVLKGNAPRVVVLDRSSFYPTSGGQEHDTGSLVIDGTTYQVVDAQKVGPCVLHFITPALAGLEGHAGKAVTGEVDRTRREQLRNHHTATHIVFASCRAVLGPHVWQHGAKKTVHEAHLDITHYNSLTFEEMRAIETEANRIVHRCKPISKGFMAKDEAEKKHGFTLYQGGVVPGNSLRVVDIAGTDTEACCGTHCDNTAEVGVIKITKSKRVSDGVTRLYYVAGENALRALGAECEILYKLRREWGVDMDDIVPSGERFFDGYKKMQVTVSKQSSRILDLSIKCLLLDAGAAPVVFQRSTEDDPTLYISNMPSFADKLKASGKGLVFVGATFACGLVGKADSLDVKDLQAFLAAQCEAAGTKLKFAASNAVTCKGKDAKGKPTTSKVTDVLEFKCFTVPDASALVAYLASKGVTELQL